MMRKHVTVLGALYIALGILGLIAALVVFAAVAGGGWISGDRSVIAITSTVGAIISAILIFLSVPSIIGGAALLKYAPWARMLVLILGVLNLLNIPFGTALAVYTMWVLLHDETTRLFSGGGAPVISPVGGATG